MARSRTEFAVGEILSLASGYWSDHGIVAFVRVAKPLDLTVESARFQAVRAENCDDDSVVVNGIPLSVLMSFDARDFADFLIAEGVVESIPHTYVHLGDDGPNPFMDLPWAHKHDDSDGEEAA